MVALASAFVSVGPDLNKSDFKKSGTEAGKQIAGGIDKELEAARDRAAKTGGDAGKKWGEGFHRDSQGKIRDAQGKFVQSSIATGGKAGKGFSGGFKKGSSGFLKDVTSNLKQGAALFAPIGLAAAVGFIGKIGIEYENNLNIFQAVTKATGKQMDDVAKKARELGADVKLPGVSAAGAAEAMTELGKAGFTVQEAMDAAQGTLQLARVAGLSEADAATIAANAVNAFGIKAKDTNFVVDELAAAANSSSIEISDASLAFKQAAAVFSGFQVESVGSKEAITELNTAIAVLGNNGIKGSDAGTSLKQALLQLTGPTQQAKGLMQELAFRAGGANITLEQQNAVLHGGKKARDAALKAIGDSNKALKKEGDIAFDGAGKMRSLRDILKLTAEGTKGMTQEERAFTITQIFGADASRSILALLKGGLPVYDAQRKAVLEQGAAAKVAAAKNKGLGGAIDNVKSQIENAAIAIYNVSKGPLTTALNAIAGALPGIFAGIGKAFSIMFSVVRATFGFLADHKNVVLGVAYAVGVLTAALRIQDAAIAISTGGGMIKYLVAFAKGTRIATIAQAAFNAVMSLNPIGITVIAIAALVAAFVIAYKRSETFRNIVQGALHGIQVAAQAVAAFFMTNVLPVLKTVWNGIATGAVWLWQNVLKPTFAALVAFFRNVLAPTFSFLWHNVVVPVFGAIGKVISVWWSVVKAVFAAVKWFLVTILFPVLGALWHDVVVPVFGAIRKIIEIWWFAIKIVFAALKLYFLNVLFPVIKALYNYTIKPIFQAAGIVIKAWWNGILKPTFGFVKAAFVVLGTGLKFIWTNVIRPMFSAFGGYIKDHVVPGFKAGVALVKAAWEKIKEIARVPVAFVVNHVINPFIGGLNAAAKIVGVKGRVEPIKGFARGGEVARAAGGKISGAGSTTDNRQAMIPGVGAVQLMGGEFVVNRRDTAKALPILKWINDGMRGGLNSVGKRIGRPLTDYPGDGSEGWAFKDGGLVGWVKDVWGAITDPTTAIKKPFDAALSRIPGGGNIKDFLVGSAKRLLKGALSWLNPFGGDGKAPAGRVGAAYNYVRAQNGKPYVWASAGPGGYDCSGIVSAAYNILKGGNPNNHTFSTESAGSFFNQHSLSGPLLAGWSHPGQSPASASVGHMAGQIAGLPFESRGSRGVIVGGGARRITGFAQRGAARLADGGQVRLFDKGGYWPSGTLGANLSGRTEFVNPRGAARSVNGTEQIHIHFHNSIVTSEKQAEDLVVKAVTDAKRKRRIT